MTRELDIVLFGATGFTGRLVADYLARAAQREPVRWAIAGRSHDKLAALGLGVPIIVGDALDAAAMRALAQRTTVVCTTVGPFARYGSELVAACAAAGTHYCDLTGEVPWMRRMIDAHHAQAQATGARIVQPCGFDSIPSDLGCWAAQQAFAARFGSPARKVTAVFGEQRGGLSGGTFASAFGIAREAEREPAVRALLANPYALDPDPAAARPPAPDETSIGWQPVLGMFTVPFVMAQVNTRVVRRGHALAGFPWGKDFTYREVMSTPGSLRGAALAAGITGGLAALALAMSQPWLRERLAHRAPPPGEGPSAETRARGHWIVRLVAEGAGGERAVYVASDRADPGYGSTSKMLGEAALCLARDPLTSPGGVLTPSVAMAQPLLDRLRRAGLHFAPA
ncbi:MAG TPA: saccharopine dehydrogenase NADP-binding domain-containing protein [Kofleriaceae bacterium]|nr:saccharopine dehydrogenase NADP-binding domain-containing protein [Kofleriaceae bacterium]